MTAGRNAMRRIAVLMVVIATVLTAACHSPTEPETTVRGTVHFFTVEGGFWALRGDDGMNYDPLNTLPSAFQQENLRVQMVIRVRTDAASVHMVGAIVDILHIQAG
jgi:hypothetical protein